jgi:ABC-type transport system involved in cytochrome bd biosynthesis fused ATPase/permease subunit
MEGKTTVSITHHVELLEFYDKIWTISEKQAERGYRNSIGV